jgi:TPR repeat protein
MKKFSFTLVLIICSYSLFAQSALEILKLEEAEIDFNKNDFGTTIQKLDELEKMTGVTSRTLYLRIVCQYNLYIEAPYKDESQYDLLVSLRVNTRSYLEGMESFGLDDKYREIYKINEDLKQYPTNKEDLLLVIKLLEEGDQFMDIEDYANAMICFLKAAEKGEAAAMTNIGILYCSGHGVTQNYSDAMSWFRKAAEKGEASAMTNIGILYCSGHGVTQNYSDAMSWFRKAAVKGEESAMTNIGILYYHGHGVTQNYLESIKWFEKAAEKDHEKAFFYAGIQYYKGQGVEQNFSKSFKWLIKAAKNGHIQAMALIGDHYSKGLGASRDMNLALDWYKKAAEKENLYAMKRLVEIYDLQKNKSESAHWNLEVKKIELIEMQNKLNER